MEYPSEDLREHTASRLPTYRHVDLQKLDLDRDPALSERAEVLTHGESKEQAGPRNDIKPPHMRNNSTSNIITTHEIRPSLKASRHLSFPTDHSSQPRPVNLLADSSSPSSATNTPAAKLATKRNAQPVTRKNHNGASYPPLSMITRGYTQDSTTTSTTNWVAQQSALSPKPASNNEKPPSSPPQPESQLQPQPQPPRSIADSASARPPIKVAPIRGFKSSRKSAEMASRRFSQELDSTVRVYDPHENLHRRSRQSEQDEHNSDESDLFLRAAREEELAQQNNVNTNGDSPSRSDSRRSRIGQRPSSLLFNSTALARRRGSDQDNSNGLPIMAGQESIAQALTYRPAGRDRPSALEDLNRTRYAGQNSRSTPTTPRATDSRERSPEEYGGRRPSVPEAILPPRASYRQSNLSYSTPRIYNSSPLVSRTTDLHDTPETPRGAEGTESTVSTTAPSTVWDELDELKSRIHRLELTGKLPPTSGAAMSRASADRPPTATTTITTLSSSPKRGRGISISPVEPPVVVEQPPAEAHPLLHAALAKAKPLLNAEIYKTLEATASDALAISSMMGTSGQPGPISSSQSTVGGPNAGVSDRQVRRKADSMCRSLTELCLALSENKNEAAQAVTSQALERPRTRDTEVLPSIETNNTRQIVNTDLNRVKSSPRALSRLEARRSSLLATSALPSPRYAPSEVGTPTQTGRRTSLFLRTRRTGTEEPEEDDTFRAPSRAITEVGRPRQSPREYTSQQPLPERSSSITSSLPVRRHYASTSLTNSQPMPPVSALNNRRYLERSTPERDTSTVIGRLAEDRSQRKSSIGSGLPIGRTGSLTRRNRQPTSSEFTAGQAGGYQ
ncbi:uncharacterized protein LY89DRAFT_729845 [Mollisia scopiformis]|uniref:LPXTG-motif cell wall anchor domain protein n=1 Tax=Mollisia scopiformis TaxID=149040 RepID=A0A194XMP2_MOLSC|nr:uncharacterized protein LY89DRAFT_729845 [Mollisia scopiformis]KUJ21042.1 hypothetical protein LY89DRAFT_729845 [Mollisia scopiformis]